MKRRFNKQDLVIIIAIATTTLYVVSRNMPPLVGSFRFFWGPLSLIFLVMSRPAILSRRPVRLFLIYGMLFLGVLQYTLWQHMTDWNISHIQNEFYGLIVFVVIWAYYWYSGDFYKLARLSKWVFVFIVITMITSNIALFLNSGVIRNSVNSFNRDPAGLPIYERLGVAGYGYAQGMVLLFPVLFFFIRKKLSIGFNHKQLVGILLVLFFLIMRMQVFANLLVAIPVTLLSVMGHTKRRIYYVFIALLSLLLVAIPAETYADVTLFASGFFETGSTTHGKLVDFADFIVAPDFDSGTQAGLRAARYPLLYDAFIAQPFLGDASYRSGFDISHGAHLYWMNRLTIWGTLGFAFFIYVLYRLYRAIVVLFDKEFRYYYNISVMGFLAFGLLKVIGGREAWLMLIIVIPGLYWVYRLQVDKKNNLGISGN